MELVERQKCFGCGACMQICSRKAVTMEPDEEGFLRPLINETRCVQCGMCIQACPAANVIPNCDYRRAYALKHQSDVRRKCTSGGAFVALSDEIFSRNGMVYGVVYDKNFKAVHVSVDCSEDRDAMCGSKYVQSDTGDSFRYVADDLRQKKSVLYSGTSCQIDGLQRYLQARNVPMDGLITCSLICHGTPSPKLWQEHLSNIRKRRKKDILRYLHRSKIRGWHEHNEHIIYCDGSEEYYSKLSQNHKDLFYGHYIIRPSCSVCPYAEDPSVADLTIADFWGVQYVMPELDDNQGVSLVLVNSEKGEALLQSCKDVVIRETDREAALKLNHHKPCKPNPRRREFWLDYHRYGYAYVCAKYAKDNPLGRIYYGAKKRLRALLVLMGVLE